MPCPTALPGPEGKTVYYSLDDDHVRTVLEQGTTHIRHKYGYEED